MSTLSYSAPRVRVGSVHLHVPECDRTPTFVRTTVRRVATARRDVTSRPVFRREAGLWELGFAGRVVRMPDLKGLADIAKLLANPGREIHSLDLTAGLTSASATAADVGRLGGAEGDLGDVIDARARDAYRARAADLAAEIESARLARDVTRVELAQLELAAIREQIERAYGIGGRVRRSGDPAERARTAVTARIRVAMRKLETEHPALAHHLRASLRTGMWCVYEPETPVAWRL